MHDTTILQDLITVMAAALATAFLLSKLRLPIIVGFLMAGVLIGPGGFSLVGNQHSIELMAEIGVVFLLFSIGLKFSVAELAHMKEYVFGAGSLQLAGTIALTFGFGGLLGLDWQEALLIGFLLAMSSTAIVFKLFEQRGETESAQGRLAVGVLIFQDLAVVPLMLMVTLMGGSEGMTWGGAVLTMLKSLGMIVLILALSRFLMPRILAMVAASRSREVFTLTTLLLTIGTAWLAGQAGLSLALGAFLAGIVISESEYSQQMLTEIAPLRDAFSSLFFISIGMLVSPVSWVREPLTIFGLTLAVAAIKIIIVASVALAFGLGVRVAVLAGLALAQIGEFSFLLAQAGYELGILAEERRQIFLSVSVLSMALTPIAMIFSPWLAGKAQRLGAREALLSEPETKPLSRTARVLRGNTAEARNHVVAKHSGDADLRDHVIIVGYGINGRNVARVLKQIGVKYLILELNPRTVRQMRAEGEAINYGDATREDVLRFASVDTARALVIAVADRESSRQVVALAHRLNPRLIIVVRTRLLNEVEALYRLGAAEVVPEEFETSLELAGRVMEQYGASPRTVERAKAAMRGERYEFLTSQGHDIRHDMTLDTLLTSSADVSQLGLLDDFRCVGWSIREMNLRKSTGASIIAILRGKTLLPNPEPDHVFQAGETLYLFGSDQQIAAARALLQGGPAIRQGAEMNGGEEP